MKSDSQDAVLESYKFPPLSSGAGNVCFQDEMPKPQIKCCYELQTGHPFQAVYTAEVWLVTDYPRLNQDYPLN